MVGRWDGAPVLVRRVVLALVLVLAYGTAVHVVDLVVSGGSPYPEVPTWLRVYFVALTALDPLAAVLLALRRRSGVVLALAVLVTDAAANGWWHYALAHATGVTAGRVGQAVITLLALAALAAAPALWRHARPPR